MWPDFTSLGTLAISGRAKKNGTPFPFLMHFPAFGLFVVHVPLYESAPL
jgi:hypothetical protein